MKRFVIGDIHGRHSALKQVLEACKFNYSTDKLVVLGDVVDGGSQTFECVEELLKIENLVFVKGNHDRWFINNIKTGWKEYIWISQGGRATLESYKNGVPVTHQDFFNRAVSFHIEDDMCFVHGGFNPSYPIDEQDEHDLTWDRSLIDFSKESVVSNYKKIFVGHTATDTIKMGCVEPLKFNNLICLDCGAGWSGKLAIMNIDTEEFWLSEKQVGGR